MESLNEDDRIPLRNDFRFKLRKALRMDKDDKHVRQRWTNSDVDMQIYISEEERKSHNSHWVVGYHGQEEFANINIVMKAFQYQVSKKVVILEGKTHAKWWKLFALVHSI